MLRPDWRNADDYKPLRNADAVTLAGEFLKRNPDYISDRKRLTRLAEAGDLTLTDRDAFATAWGLRFRGGRRAVGLDASQPTDRGRRRGDASSACQPPSPL